MNAFSIAIAIHIVAIVWWIGGVAMVTTVLLPAVRKMEDPGEGIAMFRRIEELFSWHARAATLLAAASGFYMVEQLGMWANFLEPAFWWLGAMVFVWGLFTLVLFVAEPLFLHRWLARQATRSPTRTLVLLQWLHWIALILSVVTILGATTSIHGL